MRQHILLIIAALLLVPRTGLAQASSQQAELERRRSALIAEIRQSQAQLADTRKNRNASMAQLRALQAKLNARMQLINNINEEIRQINGNISSSQQEISALQRNLEGLKARYAQSVRYEYEHRSSYNMLAFLFSARDYNVAVQRIKYLKRYRDYRSKQVAEIYQTQTALGQKIGTLQKEKGRHDMLLTVEQQQRSVLETETKDKNQVVNELRGKEKDLMATIQQNQKQTKQIDRTVQALIARQIEADRRRAAEERRKEEERKKAEAARLAAANAAAAGSTAGSGNYGGVKLSTGSGRSPQPAGGTASAAGNKPAAAEPAAAASVASTTTATRRRSPAGSAANDLNLTPAAMELSNNFVANKGRLPWPVERGNIISFFGQHPHPVYPSVIVDNPGIDIQTPANAPVRAVFDGRVSSVVSFPGAGMTVLIQHGEYYTVYNFLTGVQVKAGDEVRTRQVLGSVMLNDEDIPVMRFQVWKGRAVNNPSGWIAR